MGIINYSSNIKYIFLYLLVLGIFIPLFTTNGQGFNNNEWIFGYCATSAQRNYISFGKDSEGRVRELTGLAADQPYTSGNSALAIDPITGKILFYTNGVLVYNYYNDNITPGSGLGGQDSGIQTVAISPFNVDFNAGTPKLYYIYYITPAGQLSYAVADMANQGAAPPGQPPAGLITQGGIIAAATDAIITVNTPGSSNFIISFSEGQLEAREIGITQGEFTLTDQANLTGEPKKIIFYQESNTLLIIPTDPSQPLITLEFDTATGNFGTPQPLTQTAGGDTAGATFSPEGNYIYYSQDNSLFRIPVANPGANPEEIPLPQTTNTLYDVQVGPDGQLYYIYQEENNDAFYVGRITNPEEEDLAEIEIEHDPFDGTDFCGTIFPVFATDANIDPEVDFTWEPEMPCQNNPIQLTSSITPQNYRPVSFEWSFEPALTDEDGEEIEADYNQEHFLLPEGATAQESIQVTLTVTFADGTTKTVPKTINLTQNELQADFTPQDTTVCEGTCVDIASLLEASMGDDQGGGMGGGQQPDNLEYLWSDIRTWGGKERPCVLDKPGLYWVLVRDPQNPGCTAYASIRINVWDIDDPRNNIWYFGDGAGLDFNPDPDDPDGPIPRPIEERHPQDIPAGVTTISDASGQVLFYSDGDKVWDANHTQLADNIGGDKDASQSVLAVPVPQDETLFYLFTIGNGEAKFTVVDIKGSDGGAGFGNVTTSDNFLFSPTTEKVAAVGAGDTTWVAFHELGNNTFRFYPVTAQGIGPPVLSSVGSNHNFGSGEVGAMKFSPDGTKLAVTINDGGTNRLEIFDFDPDTGELTEYALLDLGSDGDIYGLEFSNDGSRVFVSYTGTNSRIEEFKIEPVEVCYECFDETSSRPDREGCILADREVLTSDGPFGALQIGPDGQIYAAKPGQNVVGQVQIGQDCDPSTYNNQAHAPMPGPSQLGLPAFVNNDGSSIPEPLLEGPERLCLDIEEGAIALFGGGGEPDIDFFRWTIFNEAGEEVHSESGGEDAQEIEYNFQLPGLYTVRLNVDRCNEVDYYDSFREGEDLLVLVVAQPEIILPTDASLCVGQPITLTAVDPDDPRMGEYVFEWVNAAGEILGDDNTLEVNEESIYTVTVSFIVPDGEDENTFNACPSTQSVFVGPAFQFDVEQGAEEVCIGEVVNFVPDTPILGNWYYVLNDANNRELIGEFYELELETDEMQGTGSYQIILEVADPIDASCMIEKTFDLVVNPFPDFTARSLNPNVDCDSNDGVLEIEALEDIEELLLEETGEVFTFTAGQPPIQITGLAPGNYTLIANNGTCNVTRTVTIENLNPPADYEYRVTAIPDCNIGGGALEIEFQNGPVTGSYEVTRQGGNGTTILGNFTDETIVIVPNLTEGIYTIEIFTEVGCSIPDPGLYNLEINQVEFSIPSTATSCGPYQLIPSSAQNVSYTVTDGDGNEVNPGTDGSFMLNAGTFIVVGTDGNFCPRERTIQVTIEQAIVFDVQVPANDCDGPLVYVANLFGRSPEEVNIRWINTTTGELLGRNQNFTPRTEGDYSLEVSLRGSTNCSGIPKQFPVPPLPRRNPVELSAPSSCAFEGTFLTANTILRNGNTIEWFLEGISLPYSGLTEITAASAGTYSVEIRNAAGCLVGEDSYELFISELERPVLEDSYTICAIEGLTIPLSVGEYTSYEWILDGDIVSQESVFTPTLAGNYQLRVGDLAGCTELVEFIIIEDCNPAVRIPSAMKIGHATQNFVVYANEFVTEIEVLIYNRWGELIHVAKTTEVKYNAPNLEWNGTVRGVGVPIGTYPVIIRFRSERQNLTQEIKKAILVLE